MGSSIFRTDFWIGVLLSMLAAGAAAAQEPAPAPAPAAAAGTLRSRIDFGVRFGPSFTTLTSVETFDTTVVGAAAEPTLNFGVFAAIGLRGALAFQPELLFAAKGNRVHDKNAPPVVTGTGTSPPPADRVILIRYAEFPLLLRASKRRSERSSVYLIGGPAIALRRNAVIRQVADSGKKKEITDMVTTTGMSLVAGAGLQHDRWLIDARLTRGLRNVAVEPAPEPVKTNAFTVLIGVRF